MRAHDLTYKTGLREVSEELKKQFAILARILRGIDDQSEFLKRLIQEEEEEMGKAQECLSLDVPYRPSDYQA
jgi:ppGpp synthetase/RelA/SpoT-type nucleotidyltranferase